MTTDELDAALAQLKRLGEASDKLTQMANASRIRVRTKLFRVHAAGEEMVIDAMSGTLHHPMIHGPIFAYGYGIHHFGKLMERTSIRELANLMATMDQAISWCHDRMEGLMRAEHNARLGPSGKQVAARVAMEKA
jgi:hypothetical protein